jgi:hypothetical protein
LRHASRYAVAGPANEPGNPKTRRTRTTLGRVGRQSKPQQFARFWTSVGSDGAS